MYKLIYNYNKMLLTSKCTIKTLNVNSTHTLTHTGEEQIKRLKHHSHVHLTFSLSYRFYWSALQIRSRVNLREDRRDKWGHLALKYLICTLKKSYKKNHVSPDSPLFTGSYDGSHQRHCLQTIPFLTLTEPSFQTET